MVKALAKTTRTKRPMTKSYLARTKTLLSLTPSLLKLRQQTETRLTRHRSKQMKSGLSCAMVVSPSSRKISSKCSNTKLKSRQDARDGCRSKRRKGRSFRGKSVRRSR